MNYLLDTNIISYLDDKSSIYFEKINNKFVSLNDSDTIAISILSIFEYESSISLVDDINLKSILIQNKIDYLSTFEIINLELEQVTIFGEIQKLYKNKVGISKKALKKYNFDFLIASQAIHKNLIVVSNDNIFEDIAKLRSNFKFENWTKLI